MTATDDRLSIAELQRRVAALASAPWSTTSRDGVTGIVRNDEDEQVADCFDGTKFSDRQCQENAAGIADLRNAAPVLLEICAAVLAIAAQPCVPGCAGSMQGHVPECPTLPLGVKLDDAMAKVRP